jgi:hypothetical protein
MFLGLLSLCARFSRCVNYITVVKWNLVVFK